MYVKRFITLVKSKLSVHIHFTINTRNLARTSLSDGSKVLSNRRPVTSLKSLLHPQVKEGVNTNRHPPSAPSLGWDVTSDLQLQVGAKDSRIAVTCLAVSRGHFGDAMTERAEKEIVVLSKLSLVSTARFGGPQCAPPGFELIVN